MLYSVDLWVVGESLYFFYQISKFQFNEKCHYVLKTMLREDDLSANITMHISCYDFWYC